MPNSALGFPDPVDDDGEEQYQPNRAERRAYAQAKKAEQRRGQRAWERKKKERQARRPILAAIKAEAERLQAEKQAQINDTEAPDA